VKREGRVDWKADGRTKKQEANGKKLRREEL
jgi:hypothetical protein